MIGDLSCQPEKPGHVVTTGCDPVGFNSCSQNRNPRAQAAAALALLDASAAMQQADAFNPCTKNRGSRFFERGLQFCVQGLNQKESHVLGLREQQPPHRLAQR